MYTLMDKNFQYNGVSHFELFHHYKTISLPNIDYCTTITASHVNYNYTLLCKTIPLCTLHTITTKGTLLPPTVACIAADQIHVFHEYC